MLSAVRFATAALAAGAAAASAHAASLDRSETHTSSSAASQYATFMAMRLAGYVSEHMMARDLDTADSQQRRLLLGMLRSNQGTEYGKLWRFEDVLASGDPVQAFRARHPLTRYEDYLPFVEKIGMGQGNILTKEDVALLGVTSGTSGKRHLLPCPVSIGSHFFLRGITSTFQTLFTTWPEAFSLQKTLKLTFMPGFHYTAAGVRIGPASSSPADKSFRGLLPLYSTPADAFRSLPEPEAMYLHLLFALRDRKLGIIEANFASLPYLACAKLERDWPQLADDIEKGTISTEKTPSLSRSDRAALTAQLKPDPARAHEIRSECMASMHGILRRLWPDLHLILATSTGSFAPYASALSNCHAEGVPIFSPIYAATEGLLGLCLSPNPTGSGTDAVYTLVPTSMFFEFIPEEQSSEPQPQTLLPAELSLGQRYELVVTTRGGLCRWRIGDVVELVSFHGQSPTVRFCYRQGQVLNIRGEKTSEQVVASALQQGLVNSSLRNSAIVDYTACESVAIQRHEGWLSWLLPRSSSEPHYVIFVEFSQFPDGMDARAKSNLSHQVDRCMQDVSPVYSSYRQKSMLGPVEVVAVASGTFARLRQFWLQQRGATPNQQKVPRVARDQRVIDHLVGNANW